MSSLIGNIVGSIIQSITAIVFFKEISCTESEKKYITKKDIKFLILVSFLIALIYEVKYSAINPIMSFLAIILGLIVIYNIDLSRTFICGGLFMMLLIISDIIVSIMWVSFFEIETIRGVPMYMIISNALVGAVLYILIRIKPLKLRIMKAIEITKNKNNIEIVAFIMLFVTAVGITLFVLSTNYTINKIFLLGILGTLIFILLSIIFLKEKYEKENIINKYDHLFEYVKTFEEWMDTESINIHESKNQFATLRDMVKRNKKAVEYIDNIIKERINTKSKNIRKLKYIPKGGLKGLLYYKVTIAENNGINLFIDVSSNVEGSLSTLGIEDNKMLCRLVGIFFDNAIEAAKDSNKKVISCEIYKSKKDLIIAISNTYSGKIELNKLSQNGYSTKGNNRGKGLYLAKKFSKKSDTILLENRLMNEYYVQKTIIKGI